MLSQQTIAASIEALEFMRDTLREHSNAHIEGGEAVLTREFMRIEAALAELRGEVDAREK